MLKFDMFHPRNVGLKPAHPREDGKLHGPWCICCSISEITASLSAFNFDLRRKNMSEAYDSRGTFYSQVGDQTNKSPLSSNSICPQP